ncbi:MAG TPA: sigma-70 family RNA polymerase sigma factor [Alphaproteobacteria bacterium]|nr:sigma-70 family RNA polymerase sigma factor [Alphaproteobacteria bacterium]
MATEHDFRSQLVECLPQLRAVARSLTGNRERADDLVHDTLLRALSAERQYQPGTNLRAWLLTILRNHYINELRRRKVEAEPVEDIADSALPTAPSQQHSVEFNEVVAALMKMSVEHREILVLVAAAGLSYEEAAEVCKCAIGTVKSRLNRARLELKRLLSQPNATSQRQPSAAEVRAVFRVAFAHSASRADAVRGMLSSLAA